MKIIILAAGIGKVGMEASQNANAIRTDLQVDLYENAQMKAQAGENVKQQLIGMDVGKAKDELAREKDNLTAQAESMQSGFEGVGAFANEAGKASALYKAKKGTINPDELEMFKSLYGTVIPG